MQAFARRCREEGLKIGFVPTMGCLHAGHLSLVRQARRWAGSEGRVVLSVYVNPTQFGPNEDFSKYPRNLRRDAQLCRDAGVDVLFAPPDSEIYHRGENEGSSTYVVEERLSQPMEGASRPTHFRGVTTVVAKLLNVVDPDVAVFGAKDYQQAAVVKRMVRDLHFRTRVVVAPTLREADGLAMSSRNQYLSREERREAVLLWQAIQLARRLVRARAQGWDPASLTAELGRIFQRSDAAQVDYLSFFDPVSLNPVGRVRRGTHMALAVKIGKTRLIDNARL